MTSTRRLFFNFTIVNINSHDLYKEQWRGNYKKVLINKFEQNNLKVTSNHSDKNANHVYRLFLQITCIGLPQIPQKHITGRQFKTWKNRV